MATVIAPDRFLRAQAIWPVGQEKAKNTFVGFRLVFDDPQVLSLVLRITASTLYRVTLNGHFCGHGPARAAQEYYRIDEWSLAHLVRPGRNVLAIEVAGYNVTSFYLLNQPAFLQAEVIADGQVIAASGTGSNNAFEAYALPYRVQKVQRYCFQRPFMEIYRLNTESQSWREDSAARPQALACAGQPKKKYLPRGLLYPTFATVAASRLVASGKLTRVEREVKKDRSLTEVDPETYGFPESELELIPTTELQQYDTALTARDESIDAAARLPLAANEAHILDLGCNLSGFVGATIRCHQRTRLAILWEEILTQGDVPCMRVDCANILDLYLEPGEYRVESFEPYTMRYLKLLCTAGQCEVSSVYLREYATPETDSTTFACSDPALNRIFDAAVQTFRQNAADLLTDCPSRERAGWLCDSFFSSRVSFNLTGSTRIERKFLEDFLLAPPQPDLPPGMIPMCYPADLKCAFIPQWPMWLVIELEEYLHRSGDRAMIDDYRAKVEAFIAYFNPFVNADGLLENLQGWRFIEWSKANDFVDGVNYPTNMLFAAMLEAAGRLYGQAAWLDRAAAMRRKILQQSYDGQWFVDQALRDAATGTLTRTENRTEVCQYYAFFFNMATPQTHRDLWRRLHAEFGPDRKQTRAHEQIHFANAFIGNYLRLELLSRYGLRQQLIREVGGYFLKMADTTGTLWENDNTGASCNHGFASYVSQWLLRDLLGIEKIDHLAKKITLRFAPHTVQWAQTNLPLPKGRLSVRWRHEGEKFIPDVFVPAGYQVEFWKE